MLKINTTLTTLDLRRVQKQLHKAKRGPRHEEVGSVALDDVETNDSVVSRNLVSDMNGTKEAGSDVVSSHGVCSTARTIQMQGWQGWWKHRGQLRAGHVRV